LVLSEQLLRVNISIRNTINFSKIEFSFDYEIELSRISSNLIKIVYFMICLLFISIPFISPFLAVF
jgi:hypothetical protein